MPKVHAAESSNKVVINYAVLSNATLESSAHVILKACYSRASTIDRAWRKANNILVVSSLKLTSRGWHALARWLLGPASMLEAAWQLQAVRDCVLYTKSLSESVPLLLTQLLAHLSDMWQAHVADTTLILQSVHGFA